MLQWLHQGASVWPLNFSVFTAAELEVPDTLDARYFFSFLVSTHSLVVERFVYPDRMSSGLALILQIIHLQL